MAQSVSTGSKNGLQMPLGERGEIIAWNYLREQGYKILEKNYRCKIGEIDVVATKSGRISFFEIKTRSTHHFGRPEEAVGRFKQKKIMRLAQWYLSDKKIEDIPVNFGVIGITWKKSSEPEVRLIEDAFMAG